MVSQTCEEMLQIFAFMSSWHFIAILFLRLATQVSSLLIIVIYGEILQIISHLFHISIFIA